MIFKRYGSRLNSVRPNFDAHAMTEIGFLKDNEQQLTAEEFEQQYEKGEERELRAAADGDVQSAVEDRLLRALEQQLLELESAAGADAVLVVENEQGRDMPKTRHTQRVLVEAGENRLHFEFSIDPPLRLGIYRRRA